MNTMGGGQGGVPGQGGMRGMCPCCAESAAKMQLLHGPVGWTTLVLGVALTPSIIAVLIALTIFLLRRSRCLPIAART
jgi:hypothetical protein